MMEQCRIQPSELCLSLFSLAQRRKKSASVRINTVQLVPNLIVRTTAEKTLNSFVVYHSLYVTLCVYYYHLPGVTISAIKRDPLGRKSKYMYSIVREIEAINLVPHVIYIWCASFLLWWCY